MTSSSSAERRRSGAARAIGRRALALFVVGLALVSLLLAGSATSNSQQDGGGALAPATLLPSMDLSATAATVWNCPGPLQVSGGSSASVSVANPSARRASMSVLVAETVVGPTPSAEHDLADEVLALSLPPRSERELSIANRYRPPVARHGRHRPRQASVPPTVDASVSITATGPEVAVSEIARGPSGTLASPCATGSSSAGYTASGVTAGSSTVEVSLFNPTAAPAVVNLSVGTPSGFVQPAAYQGLAIAPRSVYLVDIGRYVPLRARVAVAATATVGRLVIGSVTTVAAHFTTSLLGPAHSYRETGAAMAVGVGSPLARWEMPLGPTGGTEAEAVRIFDPGSRAASVTLRTSVPGSRPTTVVVAVASGQTVTVDAPSGSKGAATGGILEVSSAHGVGIVVAHESYRTIRPRHVVVSSASPVQGPTSTWVLPGELQDQAVAGKLVITAAGGAASVVITRLAEVGSIGTTVRLASLKIAPDATATVHLSSLERKGSPTIFGVEVVATSPVFVSTLLTSENVSPFSTSEPAVPAAG